MKSDSGETALRSMLRTLLTGVWRARLQPDYIYKLRIRGSVLNEAKALADATPTQPPAEALGADEVARELVRSLPLSHRCQHKGCAGNVDELASRLSAAIHAAEQRGEDKARRELLAKGHADDCGAWISPTASCTCQLVDILARLGEPEREREK